MSILVIGNTCALTEAHLCPYRVIFVPSEAWRRSLFSEESTQEREKPLVLGSRAGSTIILNKPTLASQFWNVATPAWPSTPTITGFLEGGVLQHYFWTVLCSFWYLPHEFCGWHLDVCLCIAMTRLGIIAAYLRRGFEMCSDLRVASRRRFRGAPWD